MTARGEPVGATLGVEEEYHLLDANTLQLAPRAELSERADRRELVPQLRPEMLTSQLEAVTDVCRDLAQVRAAVQAMRAKALAVAAEHDAVLLATSTHPQAGLDQVEIAPRTRYERLIGRFGGLVSEFNLVGLHVHVGVPDLQTAVAVLNHARPYLSLLGALTASSPFHEGRDTGYASTRLARLALWPQGGPPPFLPSAQDYLDLVAALTGTRMIEEPSELLWELRPSSRYPTLEFRVADMCPELEDVVLYAGLVRSLVRTLAGRVAAGTPAPGVLDAVLIAARWRAARYGLGGELWSPGRQDLAPAERVAEDFWRELEPDLEQHEERALLRPLFEQLLQRGSSASRQRRVLAETGSLLDVVRDGVRLTTAGARAAPGAAADSGDPVEFMPG